MNRGIENAIAIIPARMGSTRFPGKALADETGRPMVVHVCEQATKAESVDRVVVATDSQEILDAVKSHGFEGVMTSIEHTNGSSRLAEASSVLGLRDDQRIINVQGDEPEIDPELIDAASRALSHVNGPASSVGTVASPMDLDDDFKNPNVVKAALGSIDPDVAIGRALYFSRSPIPFGRCEIEGQRPLRHVGIYCYTVDALQRYVGWAPTPLECTESLEQLRWLEHGHAIAVAIRPSAHTGIDTPEQYRAFVERHGSANPSKK